MHFSELTAPEQRVLGCLIEKRWTTPDQYPLSLNALRLACNQSTNRDPVTDYDESTVRDAAQRLSPLRPGPAGQRSQLAGHQVPPPGRGGASSLDREQLASSRCCCCAARRPRASSSRAASGWPRWSRSTTSTGAGPTDEHGYARRLDRRPGQKEDRFQHLLGGDQDGAVSAPVYVSESAPVAVPESRSAAAPAWSPGPGPGPAAAPVAPAAPVPAVAPASPPEPSIEPRVAALEAEVQRLRAELDELRSGR